MKKAQGFQAFIVIGAKLRVGKQMYSTVVVGECLVIARIFGGCGVYQIFVVQNAALLSIYSFLESRSCINAYHCYGHSVVNFRYPLAQNDTLD